MKKGTINYTLLATVLLMLAYGTLMVFSASAPTAYQTYGDTYFYLWKQLQNLAVGSIGMVFFILFPYPKLKKFALPIFIIALILLMAVPAIGISVKGAKRWIEIAGQRFQPSEFMKLALIIFFAKTFSSPTHNIRDFKWGVLPYLGILGIVCGLVIIEPHMSGTIVLGFIGFLLIVLAGADLKFFAIVGGAAASLAGLFIFTSEYRMQRVLTFLSPFDNIQGDGWQIVNSLYAIGSGGFGGVGIGKSLQKFMYIPEPHNDFILSIIAEELGFVGVALVIALFVVFVYNGLQIALYAPDKFGSLVAAGITSFIALQAVINIAVVTSSMPVTGMPLPFFSYGGTSLIFLMASAGILINISAFSEANKKALKEVKSNGGNFK